jgi:Na+-driven multidrug efflux pump
MILFFKRRTSVPRLISVFYLVSLIIPLLWLVVYHTILPVEFVTEDTAISSRDILRAVLIAAIWIPYFNKSKRVKSTFCVRRITSPAGI